MTTRGVNVVTTCPTTRLSCGVGLSVYHADGLAPGWGSKLAPLGVATAAICPTASTPTIATTSIVAASIAASIVPVGRLACQTCLSIAGNARFIARMGTPGGGMVSTTVVTHNAISPAIVEG